MSTDNIIDMPDEEFLKLDSDNQIPNEDANIPVNSDSSESLIDNQAPTEQVDYKAFYEKVTAPFKADGQTINITNPDDVISLMQKGTNYTRKMQDISSKRGILKFLEDEDMLNQDTLSYLADIKKGNKVALKKLIKETDTDIFDIDYDSVEDIDNYKPNVDGKYSQEYLNFTDTLDKVNQDPLGKEVINNIYDSWDDNSKQFLFQNPDLLETLTNQKRLGIYDNIVSEINNQKALGYIPDNEPFLVSYERVGKVKYNNQSAPNPQPYIPQGVNRPYIPNTSVINNYQAQVASPTRMTPSAGNSNNVNFMNMSDEDFIKYYN